MPPPRSLALLETMLFPMTAAALRTRAKPPPLRGLILPNTQFPLRVASLSLSIRPPPNMDVLLYTQFPRTVALLCDKNRPPPLLHKQGPTPRVLLNTQLPLMVGVAETT